MERVGAEEVEGLAATVVRADEGTGAIRAVMEVDGLTVRTWQKVAQSTSQRHGLKRKETGKRHPNTLSEAKDSGDP